MQVSDAKRTRGPVRRPKLREAGPDGEADMTEQLERAGWGGREGEGGAALLSQLPSSLSRGARELYPPATARQLPPRPRPCRGRTWCWDGMSELCCNRSSPVDNCRPWEPGLPKAGSSHVVGCQTLSQPRSTSLPRGAQSPPWRVSASAPGRAAHQAVI